MTRTAVAGGKRTSLLAFCSSFVFSSEKGPAFGVFWFGVCGHWLFSPCHGTCTTHLPDLPTVQPLPKVKSLPHFKSWRSIRVDCSHFSRIEIYFPFADLKNSVHSVGKGCNKNLVQGDRKKWRHRNPWHQNHTLRKITMEMCGRVTALKLGRNNFETLLHSSNVKQRVEKQA